MNAFILACIFAVSAQNPAGLTRTVQLTTKQVKTYEHLDSLNVIQDEETFTELEQDYLFGTCAQVFRRNADLAFIQGGGK